MGEFKLGKIDKIEWRKFNFFSIFKLFHYIYIFFMLTYNQTNFLSRHLLTGIMVSFDQCEN